MAHAYLWQWHLMNDVVVRLDAREYFVGSKLLLLYDAIHRSQRSLGSRPRYWYVT